MLGHDPNHEKKKTIQIHLFQFKFALWARKFKIKTKMMNKTNVAIGVLAGVAVGAILGVLFAPDKGSVTRKKLMRKATDTADDLKDKFDDLLEEMTEKFEAAKEEASQIYENGIHKAEEITQDLKSKLG
jgi:gas vesicle protein